ncbi:DUF4159 domain-containing protein [Candidatus Omnitrophota bacterium]
MKEEMNSQRFRGPSQAINFKRLEIETRKFLVLGLIVAISIHATAGAYFMFRKHKIKVNKPLMMTYVMRQPRMTKALELKSRNINQRSLKRKSVFRRKPPEIITTKPVSTPYYFDIPMQFTVDLNLMIPAMTPFVPTDMDFETALRREPENRISMREEMISLDDLDTGQYKAMIIQDARNKRDIKGFVYISTVWGAQLKPPNHLKRSVIGLVEAVNKYTNINAKTDSHLLLDSRKLFNSPFVYVMADSAFELTKIERKNFGDYFIKGGFAVLDNGSPEHEYGQAEASLRQMLRDSLGSLAQFHPIPNDHPLYHCFFDFDDGPPLGAEISTVQTTTTGIQGEIARNAHMTKPVYYLEGIWLDERLVAVYSDKGYALKWKSLVNNDPQLKMGVNFVVFALIQSGGISRQKMDFFSSVR